MSAAEPLLPPLVWRRIALWGSGVLDVTGEIWMKRTVKVTRLEVKERRKQRFKLEWRARVAIWGSGVLAVMHHALRDASSRRLQLAVAGARLERKIGEELQGLRLSVHASLVRTWSRQQRDLRWRWVSRTSMS